MSLNFQRESVSGPGPGGPAPLVAFPREGYASRVTPAARALAPRRAAPHVRAARLTLTDTAHRASLLRVPAGRPVPHHTHRGVEYTVVLSGGFTDRGRAYRRGDFCATDPSVAHRPVAMDDAECLCLIVLHAPVLPVSRIGRLIAPFLSR